MKKDVFVHPYLERLKLHDNLLPDISTLRRIHKQHLLNIPFENLDIIADKRIEFDVKKMWMKIVEQKRGGICYELNGLLFHLPVEYSFTLQERSLDDFKERCLYFETSPDSRFRKNRLCSLERENGRISLKDDKLILTVDGIRTEKSIETEQEFLSNLLSILIR
ncbi:N-acetyltransferase [Paenibacillus sophorae]|uniref:N-acetyltransferase n=1 Tax=Paenibacillus sophorae TaxID=1333845 RepID=A0A1H8RRV4_9BACL|nr:arylamine N-acetyltransferase [Paenibacillus sophorae]QWU17006.1 arylamine N-acetyltransferase [Paenibacillus sophorae]SEO69100.1 N-acetyltransferase [Paenibacillus sophorae]